MSAASGARLAAAFGAVAVGVALQTIFAPGAEAGSAPGAFDATAAAYGSELATRIPSAPLTDTLLDSGGPTAQAALDSTGIGTGYASFPDPGGFVNGGPALANGLLNPPAPLPGYPATVIADDGTPSASAGGGPYQLSAHKEDGTVDAMALAGLNTAGTAALVESKASVILRADGSVVASAFTDVQGLSLGPVNIGDVRTVATRTLSPSGKITSNASMQITGVRAGGVDVPVPGGDGLTAAGDLGPTVEKLLEGQGVQVSVTQAQRTAQSISAPVLIITGPIPAGQQVGTGPGTFSLSLGSATARLTGVASPASYVPKLSTGSGDLGGVSTGSGSDGGTPVASGAPPVASGISPVASGISPIESSALPKSPTRTSVTSSSGSPPAGPDPMLAAALRKLAGLFGISTIYLLVVLAAVTAFVAAQLIRMIGVRAPWISSRG